MIHKEIVGYQFYFFSVYDFVCSSSLSWDIVRIFWGKKLPEDVRLLCHSLPPTDKGADFPYGFDLLLLRLSKINSEVSTLFLLN